MIATLFANAVAPWPLRAGVVHVWRFACQQDPGAHASALSDDERAAAARFVAPAHRDAYVVQHAVVRALLARYVDARPRELVFARGARGKPVLAAGGADFNLSHAADVALLAVTRGMAIGVDIERLDADIELAALRRVVLAADEAAGADDRAGFLRVWCRKEACLKATGVGLLDDLTAVSVAGDRARVGDAVVYVRDLAISVEHAAAVATSAPCEPVGANALDELSL